MFAATATEVYEWLAPALGVAVPFVTAFAVKDEASPGAKRVISIVVTVIVCAASLVTADRSDVTAAVLAERALLLFGESQLVYAAATAAVSRWTSVDGLNAVPVFRPGRGVG